jgi:hypothetical protein
MQSLFKTPQRRAFVFLGSVWAAAILFLIVRALVPA